MKKVINILLAGTTAIVMSACGSSSSSSSLPEVDISQLHEGYSISGTYASGDPATFEYCNNEVTMIAEGTRVGTFSLEVNDVIMTLPNNDYRYLVAEIIDDGVYILTLNGTYDTYDHGDFTITNISTIPCEPQPS